MTRITITFDTDLTDQRNTYMGGSIKNIGEAIGQGQVEPGQDVYVELGRGDVAHGRLVAISVDQGVGA